LLDGVEAGADNLNVLLVEEFFLVAEPATFSGSSGGVSLGKEPQKHFVTAQVFERQRFAVVSGQVKIGRVVAGLQCHRNLLSGLPNTILSFDQQSLRATA
jgi:hypothetical protein